jgi:hypothetical protein
MNYCDSPWLFAVWAFCFAEDTFLSQQNLIANFVIIIDLLAMFACCAKIGLMLPLISNFVPVGYVNGIGGPQEKMPFFQIAPGPFLSS